MSIRSTLLLNIPGKFPILLLYFWISKFLSKATVYAPVCTANPQILIVVCCIHLHIHHIPFLIFSFLDFVVFVVTALIFHQNQRKCAISSTNVAILLLLFKRAIIAPNKLIDSQHYKRRKETTIEFHSPSQSRSKINHSKKL